MDSMTKTVNGLFLGLSLLSRMDHALPTIKYALVGGHGKLVVLACQS